MDITEREVERIARSLNGRLPAFEERSSLATQLGIGSEVQLAGDSLASWRDLVRTATQKDRLADLLMAVARRLPDDKEIRALVLSLATDRPPRRSSRQALALALVVLAGAALAVAFFPRWSDDGATDVAASGTTVAPAVPSPAVAPTPPPPAPTPATPPPEEPPAVANATPPEPAPIAADAPPGDAGHAAIAANSPHKARSGCHGAPGSLIGYWYSKTSPGAVGARYTLPIGANVRADHPRREGGWRTNAPYVCGLPVGTVVRISRDPIRMPRGDYWVPLAEGDLE